MRLVPIPPPQLDDAQRQLFDSIVSFTKAQHAKFSFENHEGALIGPFNPMLHSPSSARQPGASMLLYQRIRRCRDLCTSS